MKQYCTFKIHQDLYAIEVESIQEIINTPRFTKIPRAIDHLTGMFTLRGQIVTNFCLSTLLKLDLTNDFNHCIVLKKDPDPISMNVDEVLDIIEINDDAIQPVPEMIPSNIIEIFLGIIKTEEKIITLIDMNKISN